MPRTFQPAPILFSPEDEERLARRLGVLNDTCSTQNYAPEPFNTNEQARHSLERARENMALLESEHVLRYEYLGL